jgi:thymidylate synthase
MHVIRARNVNDAYAQGVAYLREVGEHQESRAGPVLVAPCPVTTVYEHPKERVLFDLGRDANPFFHFGEALWMLAGWNDATFLDQFVHDFSARFAEEDGRQHGAYGFRWRAHFEVDYTPVDQLEVIVSLLNNDPNTRRAVLQMWDPAVDLGQNKKDIPCNTNIYFRVRSEALDLPHPSLMLDINPPLMLDMMVCCRSNDIVWGCYGANSVHFSFLQEYIAGRLSIAVGMYYQASFNFHAYRNVLDKIGEPSGRDPYVALSLHPTPIGEDWGIWDGDLYRFMDWASVPLSTPSPEFTNNWFRSVAVPMIETHRAYRQKDEELVRTWIARIEAPDWKRAVDNWLIKRRRMGKL